MAVPSWIKTLIGVTVASIVAAGAGRATPVAAQEDEFDESAFLTADEIESGSCDPNVLEASTLTDCTFQLTGEGWDFFSGPNGLVARIEDFGFAVSAPCVIEDSELVCRDLAVPSFRSEFEVSLSDYTFEAPRARISVDREFDSVVSIIQIVNRLKTVFAGADLSLEVFRAGSLDVDAPVDILLRRPGSAEPSARTRALEPGEDTGRFSLNIPDDGRWEFISCAVDTDGDCFRTGIPTAILALNPTVEPVIEGHNDPDTDRIDIVMVGTGFDDVGQLRETSERLLATDGEPIPIGAEDDIYDLAWGPFSIDPLRDNADKFNFWYLTEQNTGSPITINHQFGQPEIDLDQLGLGAHVVIVNVTLWTSTDGFRATAELPNFVDGFLNEGQAAEVPFELPASLGEVKFGSVFLPIGSADTDVDAKVLAHEFGHVLFGLRDEYAEFSNAEPTIGRPNCARDRDDAERLWGDQVGELDPMFDRWYDARETFGLDFTFLPTREDLTVGFFENGCFADESGAIRPTGDSLMNSNIPVFGAVNRRRAEQILNLWPEPPPPTTTTTSPPATQPPSTTQPPASPTTEVAAPPVDDGSDRAGGTSVWIIVVGGLGLAFFASIALTRLRRRSAT